jgi:hypothetical protein
VAALRPDGSASHTASDKPSKRPEKISFSQMREMGVRGVVICCIDSKCSHRIEVADDGRWGTRSGCPISNAVRFATCAAAVALSSARI